MNEETATTITENKPDKPSNILHSRKRATDRPAEPDANRIAEAENSVEAVRLVGATGFRVALIDTAGNTVEEKEYELDVENSPARRERWLTPDEGENRRPIRLPDGPRFSINGLKAALPELLTKADSERLSLLVEALEVHVFAFECSGSQFVPQSSLARMLPHKFLSAVISRGETEVLICIAKNEGLNAGRVRVTRPVDADEAEKMAHAVGANLGVKVSRQFFLPGSVRFTEADSFNVVAQPSGVVEVDRQKLVASGVLPFDLTLDGPAQRAARGEATRYALAHGSACPKI